MHCRRQQLWAAMLVTRGSNVLVLKAEPLVGHSVSTAMSRIQMSVVKRKKMMMMTMCYIHGSSGWGSACGRRRRGGHSRHGPRRHSAPHSSRTRWSSSRCPMSCPRPPAPHHRRSSHQGLVGCVWERASKWVIKSEREREKEKDDSSCEMKVTICNSRQYILLNTAGINK